MNEEENERMRKMYAKWEETAEKDDIKNIKSTRRFTTLLSRKW